MLQLLFSGVSLIVSCWFFCFILINWVACTVIYLNIQTNKDKINGVTPTPVMPQHLGSLYNIAILYGLICEEEHHEHNELSYRVMQILVGVVSWSAYIYTWGTLTTEIPSLPSNCLCSFNDFNYKHISSTCFPFSAYIFLLNAIILIVFSTSLLFGFIAFNAGNIQR